MGLRRLEPAVSGMGQPWAPSQRALQRHRLLTGTRYREKQGKGVVGFFCVETIRGNRRSAAPKVFQKRRATRGAVCHGRRLHGPWWAEATGSSGRETSEGPAEQQPRGGEQTWETAPRDSQPSGSFTICKKRLDTVMNAATQRVHLWLRRPLR